MFEDIKCKQLMRLIYVSEIISLFECVDSIEDYYSYGFIEFKPGVVQFQKYLYND